jgi:hypothetical protein
MVDKSEETSRGATGFCQAFVCPVPAAEQLLVRLSKEDLQVAKKAAKKKAKKAAKKKKK